MSRNPRQTWRLVIQVIFMLVSLLVGFVFRILGKNPLDPFDLFGNPQNDLFLWISITAFIVTVILSYTLWPLERALSKESPSLWYQEKNLRRVSWLAYMLLWPSLSIGGIFDNFALLSHLEIFSWLRDVTALVTVVVCMVGTVLMSIGLGKSIGLGNHIRHDGKQDPYQELPLQE